MRSTTTSASCLTREGPPLLSVGVHQDQCLLRSRPLSPDDGCPVGAQGNPGGTTSRSRSRPHDPRGGPSPMANPERDIVPVGPPLDHQEARTPIRPHVDGIVVRTPLIMVKTLHTGFPGAAPEGLREQA